MSREASKTKTWNLMRGLGRGLERLGSVAHLALGRGAAFLALGLVLAGCTVVPQYKGAPQTPLTELHNAAPVAARQTDIPAPPVETWWTGFRDPVLTRIVERALAQNLDLAAAIARVEQARAAAREAGAQMLPTG